MTQAFHQEADIANSYQESNCEKVTAAVSRSELASDPRRPQFHLLPAANWMNDPNGPTIWNGQYHMFYQYNPEGAFWGDMHWGHAMSPDLIHWRHLPVALAPTPNGPDAGGCFSGSALPFAGGVAVVYTGVVSVPEDQATSRGEVQNYRERQCVAISRDPELRIWEKWEKAIIANPPAGMDVTGFRDPSAWRDRDWFYLTVGSGVESRGGDVLVYRSRDLHAWEYLHVVASGAGKKTTAANPVSVGDMWECPELFPLGEKHVLIYSTEGKVHWQSGILDQQTLRFRPEQEGVVDYGSYYAAKTQVDKAGNRILWGWIQETRPLKEYRASGWAGMMSLPRELTLDIHGNLSMRVCPAVSMLRRSHQHFAGKSDESKNQEQIAKLRLEGCCGEILLNLRRPMSLFHMSLVTPHPLKGADAGEWIAIEYDPAQPHYLKIDNQLVPLSTANEPEWQFNLLVDGSAIELFINREVAYTKRFYYSGSSAPEMGISISDTSGLLLSIDVWQFAPISPNRLTT